MKIAVSYLSIKDNLKEEIRNLSRTSADFLHVDVMDGIFVKNKTRTIEELQPLLTNIEKPLDVHIMVSDVKKYIDEYSVLRPIYITFHYEAINNHIEAINYIKSKGIKAGISIKPDTKVDEIKHLLEYVDLVLVMSVEPGMGGQEFLDSAISKIYDLYDYRQKFNYKYVIEVDGGINDITKNKVERADILVVGNFITKGRYEEQIEKIRPKIGNKVLEAILINDNYQHYVLTEFIYNLINSNGNHLSKVEVFQLMFEPKKFLGSTYSDYEVKEVENLCKAIRELYKDKIENNFSLNAHKIIELNKIISNNMLVTENSNKFLSINNESEIDLVSKILEIKNNGNVFDYVAKLLISFFLYRPFKSCLEKTAYLIANVILIKYDNAPIIFNKEVEQKIIKSVKEKDILSLEVYIKDLSEKEKEIFKEYI